MARSRHTVPIFALLAALVAGGWNGCAGESPPPGARLLDYVPADTIFFAGQTEATLASELGAAAGGSVYGYLLGLAGGDPREAAAQAGPAAGVMVALLREQQAAVARGERPFARNGMPPNGVLAAYTVGQTPVLRWQLSEPRRFWRSLDAAEGAAAVKAQTRTRGDYQLRRYALDLADNAAELVFATGGGFAIAALHTGGDGAAALDAVLGAEKPADQLDRIALDDLARAHGFVPGTVAFLDNERLFEPLTAASDGLLPRIGRLVADSGLPLHPWLRALGAPDCREVVSLLPDYWPRTVMGVTDFDAATGRLQQRLVFESDHQRALARLDAVQGHIPEIVRAPRTVLGLGLGVDFTRWMSPPDTDDEAVADGDRADGEAEDDATATVSDCRAIAALQRKAADANDSADPAGPLARLVPRVEGMGAAVFRTPPAAGRGRRPGAASALMVATEEPDAVRAAIRSAIALEADGRAPADHPFQEPWRSMRKGTEAGAGADGLLLSSAETVLARPADDGEESGAPSSLAAFRYRHGVEVRATTAALEPWLDPLPAPRRQAARAALRTLDRLPFDLAVEVRVGETGIELDIAVTPVPPPAPVS